MKLSKDNSMMSNMLVYRSVFLYNDTQWCGWGGGKCYNRKRHVVDDWKNLYCATGVPLDVPEWNWGRGDP